MLLLAAAAALGATPPDEESLKGAVPLSRVGNLPSTSDQFRALKDEIARNRPAVESAKRRSDTLNAEEASLRQRLVSTAAEVQALEEQQGKLDGEIANLAAAERQSSAQFQHDRANVVRLLAVLERLQQDMPPALAMRPDDALAASRGAMMLGTTVPRIYKAAAELAQRVASMKRTHTELIYRRSDGARNEARLTAARSELDQLLAMKAQEADEASAQYGDLAAQLDSAANEATNLETLLAKVSALRGQRAQQAVVVVAAQNTSLDLGRRPMLRPVVGRIVRGDADSPGGQHAPGMSFLAPPSARVVAPADCQVLFAGRYHKTGQVLILESAAGYDLVLAGMERVDVRSGDALLAGEPLGVMPGRGTASRLYFEVRQNGKGVSPAPWLEIDLRKAKRS